MASLPRAGVPLYRRIREARHAAQPDPAEEIARTRLLPCRPLLCLAQHRLGSLGQPLVASPNRRPAQYLVHQRGLWPPALRELSTVRDPAAPYRVKEVFKFSHCRHLRGGPFAGGHWPLAASCTRRFCADVGRASTSRSRACASARRCLASFSSASRICIIFAFHSASSASSRARAASAAWSLLRSFN